MIGVSVRHVVQMIHVLVMASLAR